MSEMTIVKREVMRDKPILSWQKATPTVRKFKDKIQVMGVTGIPLLTLTEDEASDLAGAINNLIEQRYVDALNRHNQEDDIPF